MYSFATKFNSCLAQPLLFQVKSVLELVETDFSMNKTFFKFRFCYHKWYWFFLHSLACKTPKLNCLKTKKYLKSLSNGLKKKHYLPFDDAAEDEDMLDFLIYASLCFISERVQIRGYITD